MNVGQLIEELEKYPADMDVFMAERKTLFTYGLVNSIEKKEIRFMENDDGNYDEDSGLPEEEQPLIDCVVLDEE